jgi:hypothetical protein
MGQVSTEQTVKIIEAVADAIETVQPEVVETVSTQPSNWWLLTLAVVPVLLGYWLNMRKK